MYENKKKKNGFTLIELLIVVALLAFISTAGLASYISFNDHQVFNNAYQETKSVLQRAQSLATSQVIPQVAQCMNQPIQGYRVQICSKTAACSPSCAANNRSYTISAICNGQPVLVNTTPYQLPGKTSFTSSACPTFLPLTGGAIPGTITITDGTSTKTITINNTGVIQ